MHAKDIRPALEMASCDGARAAWFRPGGGAAPTAPDLDWIRMERHLIREEEGGGGQSAFLADAIERELGWPSFTGVYLAPSGEPIRVHAWNVLPDGRILDATADQFGEGRDLAVVAPGDPAWARYRAEWTPAYNPSLAARHPELAGCEWGGRPDMAALMSRIDDRRAWWLPGGTSAEFEAWETASARYAEGAAPGPGPR